MSEAADTLKRELETDEVDENIELKKVKVDSEEQLTEKPQSITNQVDDFTNSPSPLPHALTSKSRSEIRAQIDELQDDSKENSPVLKEEKDTPSTSEQPDDTKIKEKTNTIQEANEKSRSQNSKMIIQSNRKVEDIIDGSDLRKFLNKTLSGYLVKGLDEIVKLWESGEFELSEGADASTDLKKSVVLKFSDILKQLSEKESS